MIASHHGGALDRFRRPVALIAITKTAGTSNKVNSVELESPATTVTASGRRSSAPSPSPRAIGINPNTVVSSVANLSNQWLGAGNGLVHSAQFFVAVNGLMMILVGVAFVRGKGANATNARFFATTWAIVILAFSIAWPILLHFQGHFDFDTPARYGLLLLPLSALAITEGVVRARVQSPDMAENVTPRA